MQINENRLSRFKIKNEIQGTNPRESDGTVSIRIHCFFKEFQWKLARVSEILVWESIASGKSTLIRCLLAH